MNGYRIGKEADFTALSDPYYDGWRDHSDADGVFRGETLTEEEYERAESALTGTAFALARKCGVEEIALYDCEGETTKDFFEGATLSVFRLPELLSNLLRGNYRCKIRANGVDFFVHNGYDFTLYVICNLKEEEVKNTATEYGIFAIAEASPYFEEC